MRERDSQRNKVYTAERNAGIFQVKKLASFEEAVKFGKRVVASKHWQKNHPNARVRSWSRSSGYRSHASAWNGVTLAAGGGFDAATVLHELAHVATTTWGAEGKGEGWHGRAFVRVHLALVRRFLGREVHDKLKAELKASGAKFVRRPKPKIEIIHLGSLVVGNHHILPEVRA